MTKSDLAKSIALERNISDKQALTVVNAIFDSMKQAIVAGGRVEVRSLGIFSLKSLSGYVGRNPKTGTSIVINPKKCLHFKAGKEVKERLVAVHRESVRQGRAALGPWRALQPSSID